MLTSFQFLPLVLDHACFPQQPLTFEILSRLCFPSQPDTSIAAMIFQTLPVLGGRPEYPMQTLVDFTTYLTHLWAKCNEEQFWAPIKYLISLISFTLNLQASEVAPYLFAILVPVAVSTIQRVIEHRHRRPEGEHINRELNELEEHIDTTEILQLLHTTALTCVTAYEETILDFKPKIVQFWSRIDMDFFYLITGRKQLLGDVLGMLELLTTSALPESIGPISEDGEPIREARIIIERISAYLVEVPRGADTLALKRSVRLAVLRTLIAFARYPFGAIQLASHNTALPRLVTCLSASLDALYDQPIPPDVLPPVTNGDGSLKEIESPYSELCRIISQCVMLIHTLVTSPHTANIADISQKLSVHQGGSQRYLLALGRLTFAEEDLVMEAGIDGDTVEAAHELLEMIVTPDEGEVVSEAFGA